MSDVVKYEGGYSIADIRKQMELIKKFNLPETAVESHYVKVGRLSNGKETYTLCKREQPIKVYDPFDDSVRVVCQMNKTMGEMRRLSDTPKRGKYNDEHKLIPNEAMGIEVGEVEEWS